MLTDGCDNKWCVYYKAAHCTLAGITVNSCGVCDSCVMLEPDEALAAPLRQEMTEAFDRMDDAIEERIKNGHPL